MKTPRLKLAASLAMAMVCIGSPALGFAADKPMSTREMMRLSVKAADEKVKRDLLSLLLPTGKYKPGHVIGVPMYSAPYSLGLKALCRRDELFLHYGPTAKSRNFDDISLRPVSFEAERQFHATGGPVTYGQDYAQEVARGEADCRKLKSDKSAAWFSASTDEDAAKGVNVFLAAMAAMRSGSLKATDCHLNGRGRTCEEQLLQLDQVSGIGAVEKVCASPQVAAGPDIECFKISMGEYDGENSVLGDVTALTIVASFGGSIEPVEVQSLSASEFLVVP